MDGGGNIVSKTRGLLKTKAEQEQQQRREGTTDQNLSFWLDSSFKDQETSVAKLSSS